MPIAVITGGSRGLGRNAALHLARAGAGIVLTYQQNAEAAAEAVAEIRALGGTAAALPLDTGQTAEFAPFAAALRTALQENWGVAQFDWLVNNAGYGIMKPFAETTETDFDGLCAVHLKGVFFLTQTLLPLIADGGRILNVSSGLSRFTMPGYAAYATMKGGVEVLTRYMARDLAPRRIAVNAIAPGATETDFGGGRVRDVPAARAGVAASTAMGRPGLPDDIGRAIAAILSDGGWITGQRIEASGGQNL